MITADSSCFFMRSPGDWKAVLPKHEAVMRENTHTVTISIKQIHIRNIANNKQIGYTVRLPVRHTRETQTLVIMLVIFALSESAVN